MKKFRTAVSASALVALCISLVAAPSQAQAAGLPGPTAVTTTLNGSTLSIGFAPVAGATSYSAQCRVNKTTLLPEVVVVASPITVPGLTVGNTYTCYVNARNATVVSEWIPTNPADIKVLKAPSVPSVSRVVPAAGSVMLYFATPATGVTVDASCSPLTGGAAIAASSTTSPLIIVNATPATTYRCSLNSWVLSGGQPLRSASTYSPDVTIPVAVAGAPSAPTITKVTTKSGTISVSVIPPFSGAPVTSFTASCTRQGSPDRITGTAAKGVIELPVAVAGEYSCLAQSVNAAGVSGTSGLAAPIKAEAVPTVLPAPKVTLSVNTKTGTNVNISSISFPGATSYKFSCKGISSSVAGRDTSDLPATPSTSLKLETGDWLCTAQALTAKGLTPESTSTRISVASGPTTLTVSKRTAILSRPKGSSGNWSATCKTRGGDTVTLTRNASKISVPVAPGIWRCFASTGKATTTEKIIIVK